MIQYSDAPNEINAQKRKVTWTSLMHSNSVMHSNYEEKNKNNLKKKQQRNISKIRYIFIGKKKEKNWTWGVPLSEFSRALIDLE